MNVMHVYYKLHQSYWLLLRRQSYREKHHCMITVITTYIVSNSEKHDDLMISSGGWDSLTPTISLCRIWWAESGLIDSCNHMECVRRRRSKTLKLLWRDASIYNAEDRGQQTQNQANKVSELTESLTFAQFEYIGKTLQYGSIC